MATAREEQKDRVELWPVRVLAAGPRSATAADRQYLPRHGASGRFRRCRTSRRYRSAYAQAGSRAQVVPAEITFKPTPVYTEEARKLHIEGEVLLEVVFEASGKLRVQRVIRGWAMVWMKRPYRPRNRSALNRPCGMASPRIPPPFYISCFNWPETPT